jgi:signal transduction histidine kinase
VAIRVLLADDHDIVREGLRVFLGRDPDLEVIGEAADSQTLYAIGLGTTTVQNALENDPEQVKASFEYVNTLVEAGLAEMRALIFELRPEFLETEGLVAVLMKQVDVLRARHQQTQFKSSRGRIDNQRMNLTCLM